MKVGVSQSQYSPRTSTCKLGTVLISAHAHNEAMNPGESSDAFDASELQGVLILTFG